MDKKERTNRLYLYLTKNKKGIIFYLFCMSTTGLMLFLVNTRTDIIEYLFLMQLFVGGIIACIDFFYFCRKLSDLQNNLIQGKVDALSAEYIRMINALENEKNEITGRDEKYRHDMVDYYTLWAHQIKTPIAAMHLTLQDYHLILDDQYENKNYHENEINEIPNNKQREFVCDMEDELFKIEQYVEMVLSYLRLESTSSDYMIKHYKLEDIVKQAVRKFAKQFIRKKINIELTNLDILVLTDEKWLLFVVEQLISNALKYTNSGTIKIFVENQNTLVIQDPGIGIREQDLPRIFEKGFTGYNGRSNKKSTGIGLYLCDMILKRLGHSISVTSKIKEGSSFMITFNEDDLPIE